MLMANCIGISNISLKQKYVALYCTACYNTGPYRYKLFSVYLVIDVKLDEQLLEVFGISVLLFLWEA